MTRHLLWICTSLCAGILASNAQTASKSNQDVPPPQAPFVAPAPENGQWTITLKYGKEAQGTGTAATATPVEKTPLLSTLVQQVRVTKTGNLKRDIYTYVSGNSSEVWYYERTILTLDSTGNKVLVLPLDASMEHYGERGDPLRSTGYPGLSWLKESNYDGVVKFQSELCYHYALKSTRPATASPDPISADIGASAEAWINVKTNLPVAYRFDGVLYIFTFESERPAALSLPPKFQAELDLYKRMTGR